MKFSATFLLVISSMLLLAQPKMFNNPIIPGGHPDPSICRVGDDYYIANSSFIWFPGVPIHRSKDLVNWELISYALPTSEHINIQDRTGVAGGLWAPTIRYHDGLFYLTVTQRNSGASVLVLANDPKGPWSKPIPLHSQKGIDGSLLFDDDGKVWYTWSQEHKIWLREFDNKHKKLIGDTLLIMDEVRFEGYSHIEGPHIYKLASGEYMLLIASGGTGNNRHNVSVFKSDKVTGPYMPNPNNPVLTHNEKKSPIERTGHADIVQTPNGETWAVMLGVRKVKGEVIMGRETFLTKFVWKDGWPVANPDDNHMVMMEDERPDLPWSPVSEIPVRDDFNEDELGLHWNFYHTPHKKWWSVEKSNLVIHLQKTALTEQTNTPVIARRITQPVYSASTLIDFEPKTESETAGLVAMMNQNGQLRLEITKQNEKKVARLMRTKRDRKKPLIEEVIEVVGVPEGSLLLKLDVDHLDYRFYVGTSESDLKQVGDVMEGKYISKRFARGYSGAYVGVFGSSQGKDSKNKAVFNWFDYLVK